MRKSIGSKGSRRRESAETWAQRLDACRQSGRPVREYCRREGIALSTYYRWNLKLKGRVRKARKHSGGGRFPAASFIPVQVREEAHPTAHLSTGQWACEVTGASRVRLRLRERPDWRELLQLVAVMAGEA